MDALTLGRLLGSLESRDITVAHVVDRQPPFVAQTHEYAQDRREKVSKVLEPAFSAAAGRRAGSAHVDRLQLTGPGPLRAGGRAGQVRCAGARGWLHAPRPDRSRGGGQRRRAVVLGSALSVVVAPRGFAEQAPAPLGDVVVGFDGSPESRAALHAGHALARAAGSALRVVAVVHHSILHRHPDEGGHEAGAALQARLDEAVAELGGGVDTSVVEGDPVDQLAEAAKGAGILVLGGRGYGPMHHVLAGSVSAKLMRCAPSPVLVLPRSAPDPGVTEAARQRASILRDASAARGAGASALARPVQGPARSGCLGGVRAQPRACKPAVRGSRHMERQLHRTGRWRRGDAAVVRLLLTGRRARHALDRDRGHA